jgi:DNA-binding winged helix-turn-helix (wHTH) protein
MAGASTIPPVSRVVTFGPFRADLVTRELRRSAMLIPLQPKPFGILAALLERPGALVTRRELHARLWPDDVFVDFEHGLNKAMSKLREALGDREATPLFIETLSRRGYRFLAGVEFAAVGEHMTAARLLWEGRTVMLPAGAHVIGRHDQATVHIDSYTVSRHHAELEVTDTCARIHDLGSKNGTRVNDEKISGPTVLSDGDRIGIGAATLVFRMAAGRSTQTLTRSG